MCLFPRYKEGRTPVANLRTLAVCTFAERAMAGAAVRRRQRFLRSMWRHEQLSLKMMAASVSHHSWQNRESVGVQTDAVPTLVDEHVAPAAHAATASLIPVTEYATPALVKNCTDRSPVIEYVTPGLAVSYTAPTPEIEYVPDDTDAAPASLTQHIALTPEDTICSTCTCDRARFCCTCFPSQS